MSDSNQTKLTLYGYVTASLANRGVQIEDVAEVVHSLQADKIEHLKIETCLAAVKSVLSKRETQNAIITGIALDVQAEKHLLPEPLQSIIMNDEGLYGIDENIAMSICNVYGSIGITNYGFVDRVKTGLIKELDTSEEHCNTFLDDLVGAVAAASAAKIAHEQAGDGYANKGLEYASQTLLTSKNDKDVLL